MLVCVYVAGMRSGATHRLEGHSTRNLQEEHARKHPYDPQYMGVFSALHDPIAGEVRELTLHGVSMYMEVTASSLYLKTGNVLPLMWPGRAGESIAGAWNHRGL